MTASHARRLTPALLLAALACGAPADKETAIMDADNPGLESDPNTYQLNSVLGRITAGGEGLADATVTVVQTGEEHAVSATGRYLVVLDPAKLGRRRHELVFAAPGCVSRTETVFIPENNQTRFDVELERAD